MGRQPAQCRGTKADGTRCKHTTLNESGMCGRKHAGHLSTRSPDDAEHAEVDVHKVVEAATEQMLVRTFAAAEQDITPDEAGHEALQHLKEDEWDRAHRLGRTEPRNSWVMLEQTSRARLLSDALRMWDEAFSSTNDHATGHTAIFAAMSIYFLPKPPPPGSPYRFPADHTGWMNLNSHLNAELSRLRDMERTLGEDHQDARRQRRHLSCLSAAQRAWTDALNDPTPMTPGEQMRHGLPPVRLPPMPHLRGDGDNHLAGSEAARPHLNEASQYQPKTSV